MVLTNTLITGLGVLKYKKSAEKYTLSMEMYLISIVFPH